MILRPWMYATLAIGYFCVALIVWRHGLPSLGDTSLFAVSLIAVFACCAMGFLARAHYRSSSSSSRPRSSRTR